MKLQAFDKIEVRVDDDGTTTLTKVNGSKPNFSPDWIQPLSFAITEIGKGSLDKELISYGHEAGRVKEAIDEVIADDYNVEVTV